MSQRHRQKAVYIQTLLEVPVSNEIDLLPAPAAVGFTVKDYKRTSKWHQIKLVISDADGNHVSIGHDKIPIRIVQAAAPLIDKAIRNEQREIRTILLPGKDGQAYSLLFDCVVESFNKGRFMTPSPIPSDESPPNGYLRLLRVSKRLGMTDYTANIDSRIESRLMPVLGTNDLFTVRPIDFESALNEFQRDPDVTQRLAHGLGRALAHKRVIFKNMGGYRDLLSRDAHFKIKVDAFKTIWLKGLEAVAKAAETKGEEGDKKTSEASQVVTGAETGERDV